MRPRQLALLLVAVAACSTSAGAPPPGGAGAGGPPDRGPAGPGAAAIPVTAAGAAAPAAPPATLAADALDLAANRVRLHAYDRGLVVPLLGEGFRIYDQAHRSGWGGLRDAGGTTVRAVGRGETGLTLPWAGGAAALVVRGAGLAEVTVTVDGRRRVRARLADGVATLPLGALAAGEHALGFAATGAGGLSSVELVDAAAPPGGCARSPGRVDADLAGWPRLELLVEVPPDAQLELEPVGQGPGAVEVTGEDGAAVTLWRGEGGAGRQVLALDRWAGQLVALSLRAPGCGLAWRGARLGPRARPPAPRGPHARNVVLVVVDTLRADRLAVNGPTRVETPRITAAAAGGVVFRRDQAMAPSSPPSHATLQTGVGPRVHGAGGDQGAIKPGAPVLARILGDAGFYTGYVGNNDFAMARLRAPGGWREFHTPSREGQGIDCKAIVARTLAMAKTARDAGQRFFLSALPVEPHVPYRFHPGITTRYYAGPFDAPFFKEVTGEHLDHVRGLAFTPHSLDQLRGLHDGEVTYFDGCFGALLDGLAALGVADDTAVVLTSDHGEGLGERGGRLGHAYSLNHELVAVPLVILGGGLPPAAIDVVTSGVDVAPTILDLLGLPADPRMQGRSLVPLALAGGRAPARVVASEYGKALALRGGRWHLVLGYDLAGKLHDVVADPGEARDLTAAAPTALRYLRDAAGLYLAHRVAWRAATWGGLADLAPGAPLAAAGPEVPPAAAPAAPAATSPATPAGAVPAGPGQPGAQ